MGRIKKEKDYISDDEYSSILYRLYYIADTLQIPLWLTFGTLLGLAQQGMRFKWDNDIDVGTTPEGFTKLTENLELVKKLGFFIRDKERDPHCYRGLFIYDPKIQPFHVDISEFVPDENGRFTFRWIIRITLPSKVFNVLDKILMTIAEIMNKNKDIPFKDTPEYKNLHRKDSITNKLIKVIAKADLYFSTFRELAMPINAFARIKYYNTYVLVPLPLDNYCAVNYGKNWTNPIMIRHTKGGSECLRETKDGIQRCWIL